MGVKKRGKNPQIIHFNNVFHYKPSILGYPYFWKHPDTVAQSTFQGVKVGCQRAVTLGAESWLPEVTDDLQWPQWAPSVAKMWGKMVRKLSDVSHLCLIWISKMEIQESFFTELIPFEAFFLFSFVNMWTLVSSSRKKDIDEFRRAYIDHTKLSKHASTNPSRCAIYCLFERLKWIEYKIYIYIHFWYTHTILSYIYTIRMFLQNTPSMVSDHHFGKRMIFVPRYSIQRRDQVVRWLTACAAYIHSHMFFVYLIYVHYFRVNDMIIFYAIHI